MAKRECLLKYYEEYYCRMPVHPPPLPLYGIGVGKEIRIKGKRITHPGVKNNFIEMDFTLSGTALISLYRQEYLLKPGSVFLYYPGEEHSSVAESDFWTLRWLTFNGPLAMAILTSYNYPRLIEMPPEFFCAKLDAIQARITESQPRSIRETSSEILSLLSYPGSRADAGDSSMELIRTAITYICDNLSNPELDVNSVADYLGVHRSTFSRLFKQEYRNTPHFFIQAKRMGEAKALLTGSRTSVARIAKLCGFRDSTTFCRLFKLLMHVTPTQYRYRGGGTYAEEMAEESKPSGECGGRIRHSAP